MKPEQVPFPEDGSALLTLRPIARIRTDFPSKFGIPRQAGVVPMLRGTVVFEPEYRVEEALRGLEQFSHIWLIWGFSENFGREWSSTVRPPRLGGNTRMGVFATRSPFRPNALGLSCVRLLEIHRADKSDPDNTEAQGLVLEVAGADMMDGTPIYDIKPYIPYADSIPDASGGFAPDPGRTLSVRFPEDLQRKVPEDKRESLSAALANDPRPRYQRDPERVYGMSFAGLEVRFLVKEGELTVTEVTRAAADGKGETE